MRFLTVVTHTDGETRTVGRELAPRLHPGDVVLLEGPLGSGKTTFVQGIAEGLGVSAPITSPSFVIVNEYALARSHAGTLAHLLRHIDLYRLPDPSVDLDRIGLPELLDDPDAITAVEWVDRMPAEALPAQRAVRVRCAHGESPDTRAITIEDVRESGTTGRRPT